MNERVGIFGAIGAAVLASVCCIGPVVLAGLGIGAVTAAQQFAALRPYFLALTTVLLGLGFYFAYRKPKRAAVCDGEVCEAPRMARWGRPLLWFATVIVVGLVTFPYYYAPLRAAFDRPNKPVAAPVLPAGLASVTLKVNGMTCEGCAFAVKKKLLESPGVAEAEVNYPAGTAGVKYDPAKTTPAKLIEAVEASGYRAELSNPTTH